MTTVRFWLLALLGFGLVLWALKPMLLPFVLGCAIAYFFDPVVDRLEDRKCPRWLGTTLVLGSFAVVVVGVLLLVVPFLQHQVLTLLADLPAYSDRLKGLMNEHAAVLMKSLSPEDMQRLRDAAAGYASTAVSWVVDLFRGILSGGFAVIDTVSLLIITPVVAFYMLRDWDTILHHVDSALPRAVRPTIHREAGKIDETLAGFLRGQALVCVSLGLFYGISLTLAGLNFGGVVGVIAGILSFIPYVGTLFGFFASTILALMQFDDTWRIAVVVGLFVIGQMMEGYFLTPRLVGHRVGLHPVWILFAIMAGGTLFGFVGVLIAVPLAASLGVLIRFALTRYKASRYYGADAS
jgi:predicted PurR-regulated permease PerM